MVALADPGIDVDAGEWLVAHRAGRDRGEAEWLERLAGFDRDRLWQLDGQFSCRSWLVWRMNMARATAFDKLRVAHELQRRPIVAAAFRDGRISYSAVRAITRMADPDPEVDEAMVTLASSGRASILDVERAVRAYRLYHDQDKPLPDDDEGARNVRIVRGDSGKGQVIITLGDLEIEEFAAALQAFIDLRYRPQHQEGSSGGDSPVDNPDTAGGRSTCEDKTPRAAVKADALMDLVHTALAHADEGQAAGDDRYLVHVVTRDNGTSIGLVDGTPLPPADAEMIGCDTSHVTHLISDTGEPLNLGRKTRDWNTAQRRAIGVRDGGQCRFVGCYYRHFDVHHMREWEAGGPTDMDNGFAACRRHHRKLHAGFTVAGDPNAELRFYRPDGTYIGSTHPAEARHPHLAVPA